MEERILQECIKKREGKLNKSWDELAKEYGFKSGENLRCRVKKCLKDIGTLPSRKDVIDDETQNKLDDIDLKIIELSKQRKMIQTTKLEYNQLIRDNARHDMIIEALQESMIAVKPTEFHPIVKDESVNKVGIMSFADVHFGKIFKSLTNEYSEEITYQRMNELMEETLKICKKEKFNKLIIINGADSIEGMCLRVSALQSLSIGMTDMVIKFSRFMVDWLNKLSEYIYIDYYHVPQSNHSQIRPLGTKANQFQDEDMERIIIAYIHDMLKNNNRITVSTFDKDFIEFSILNYNVISIHGHKVKNIKNIIKDLSIQHRKFYDYCFMAHLHHSESLAICEGETNNCEVLLIPSIMGADDFSDSLMKGSKAGARLDIFEENKGRTITYNITLN